jgi:hypothetical protein
VVAAIILQGKFLERALITCRGARAICCFSQVESVVDTNRLLMKKPTLNLESREEKELLKVLLRLSASQTDQPIVAMGSPIPMSIINSSVIDIFFAWKEGQPSFRDLQNLMCALENLSERMIDFGPDYEAVPLLKLSKLYLDKDFTRQAGIEVQLSGYIWLLESEYSDS